MKTVETLTLNETMDIFRAYGVSMSYETLTTLIDGRAVPWAVSARTGGEGPYLRKIFKRPLLEWLDGMATEAAS